jgi:hypothetical protein
MLGEWIDQGSAEGLKIIHITSYYRQSANQRRGSYQGIFKMVVRTSVHELAPATEDRRICRKHTVALLYSVEPELDFFGLRRILFTGNFYPSLYFTHSHSGHIQGLLRRSLNPSNHTFVRLALAQFGNDIRIEEIHVSRWFVVCGVATAHVAEC